jgi:hypothetical protein
MPPKTGRDFQKAAAQRFTTAEFLLGHKYTLDAEYLGGYTIECSLKALILEKTPVADRQARLKEICAGAKNHRPEVLLGVLRDLGLQLPLALAKRYRRLAWSTDLRYETGHRDTGETRAFLKTASETY